MINKFNKIFFATVVALYVIINFTCIAMAPSKNAAHQMVNDKSKMFVDEEECVSLELYFAVMRLSGGISTTGEPDFSALASISNEYFMSRRLDKNVSTQWGALYGATPTLLSYLIVREHRPIHIPQIRENFSEMIESLIPVLSGKAFRSMGCFGSPSNLFWSWLIISSVDNGLKCLTFDEFNDNIAKINQAFSSYIINGVYRETIGSLLQLPHEEVLDRLNSKIHGIISFSKGSNNVGIINLFDIMCILDADSYKLLSSVEEVANNITKHYKLLDDIIMFAKKASEHVKYQSELALKAKAK